MRNLTSLIWLLGKVKQVSRVDGQCWEGDRKSQCWPNLHLQAVHEDQRRVLCKLIILKAQRDIRKCTRHQITMDLLTLQRKVTNLKKI